MPPVDDDMAEKRRDVIRELASTPSGLDRELERTIPYGVAFHHAGNYLHRYDYHGQSICVPSYN